MVFSKRVIFSAMASVIFGVLMSLYGARLVFFDLGLALQPIISNALIFFIVLGVIYSFLLFLFGVGSTLCIGKSNKLQFWVCPSAVLLGHLFSLSLLRNQEMGWMFLILVILNFGCYMGSLVPLALWRETTHSFREK